MKNIDEIMQLYDSFIQIVRQLSASAEEQIKMLRGFVVTDEIALDFSDTGIPYARELLEYGWITQDQFDMAQNIDKKLDEMSQKKELWSDAALISSIEWDTCRKCGMDLLHTLEN